MDKQNQTVQLNIRSFHLLLYSKTPDSIIMGAGSGSYYFESNGCTYRPVPPVCPHTPQAKCNLTRVRQDKENVRDVASHFA